MKKLIFCALCFSFSTTFGQIKLEALVGYNDVNFSNIGRLPFKDYQYYSSINSFQIGAGAEIPLGRKWFLEPALLYFGSGSHISEQSLNPGIDWDLIVDVHLYYLRIPANLIYKTELVKSVHFFAGAGLYFSRGLWGKENGQLITEGGGIWSQNVDNNIKFHNGTSTSAADLNFNPYDIGYNVLAGIEWKQFQLTSGISNGLIQVFSGYNYNLWNSAFSVCLSYKFAVIPQHTK